MAGTKKLPKPPKPPKSARKISKSRSAAQFAKGMNVSPENFLSFPNSLSDSTSGRPFTTLREHITGLFIDGLTGKLDKKNPDEEILDGLREKCRQGNPFPLVAHQWPFLVINNPAEAKFFQGVMGDPENPCLRLDDWQRQIIASAFDSAISEIAVKGNTKAGKGTSVSIVVNLWYDVYPEAKIVLTSQRHQHAVDVIFGEVVKWRVKMTSGAPARIKLTGFSDTESHYITVANPQSGEGFSGQHGPRTLFVFDESTSVPNGFYDDAHKQAKLILALANPRFPRGFFYSMFRPCADVNKTQFVNGEFGLRLCMTVDGANCMNVRNKRLEKPLGPAGGIEIDGKRFEWNEKIPPEYFAKVYPLIPNQCDYGRFAGICRHRDPNHVAVFGHGHFPKEDAERQVILPSWLEFHEAAWKEGNDGPAVEAFGLDVARSLNGDSTCFAAGGKDGVRKLHLWQYGDITFTVAEAMRIARDDYGIDLRLGRVPVTVDMDGLGCGAGDQLKAMGVWVIPFKGNAVSGVDPKTYANLRAEAYTTLGRRLNPLDRWMGQAWALPSDNELREELCAPDKMVAADGLRFKISPKNTVAGREDDKEPSVKEKIGRSPDKADGVVYLWHAVMTLHNYADWLRESQRELTVWPIPEAAENRKILTPEEIAAAAEKEKFERENEPEILKLLRANYGHLQGRDVDPEAVAKKSKEPNWAFLEGGGGGNGNGAANGNGKHPAPQAGEPTSGAAKEPEKENGKEKEREREKEPAGWQSRVRWDD